MSPRAEDEPACFSRKRRGPSMTHYVDARYFFELYFTTYQSLSFKRGRCPTSSHDFSFSASRRLITPELSLVNSRCFTRSDSARRWQGNFGARRQPGSMTTPAAIVTTPIAASRRRPRFSRRGLESVARGMPIRRFVCNYSHDISPRVSRFTAKARRRNVGPICAAATEMPCPTGRH